MLKFSGDLSDDYEYGIIWWGQSNARPWGDRDLEGYASSPHLRLAQAGQDLTINRIEGYPAGATHGAAGTQSRIYVADLLVANHYVGAELRLIQAEAQDSQYSSFAAGIATVIGNTADALVVQWTTGFRANNTTAVEWTYAGYVHLQDRWKGYGNVRVLTPYQPEAPGSYPAGVPSVPGYAFPTSVTGYDSAGVFLPFAWDEGAEGYGASRAVVSIGATQLVTSFDLQVISTASFEAGSGSIITASAHGMTNGSKVIWPVVTDLPSVSPAWVALTAEYYVVDATENTFKLSLTQGGAAISWSGYSPPGSPVAIALAKLPFRDGVLVGGTVRAGGSVATVTANTGATLTLAGGWSPSTPNTATTYEVCIPHWRNSPYYAAPGAGFRYPSNDMMPGGTGATGRVYNRPAGQYEYSYKITALEASPANAAVVNNNGLAQSVGPYTTEWAYIAGSAGLGWRLRVKHVGTASTPATGLAQFEKYLRGKYMVSLLGFSAGAGELSPNGLWRVASMTPSGGSGSYIDLEAIGFRSYSSPTVTVRQYDATAFDDSNERITLSADSLAVGDAVIFQSVGGSTLPTGLSFDTVYYVNTKHGSTQITVKDAAGVLVNFTGAGSGTSRMYSPPSLHKTNHNGIVTRVINQIHHRFGSMVEFAWRLSNMIGKRIHVIELGINSSAQIFRNMENRFGFPGQIGWWDFNKYLDWTPSDPDGNAVRLQRMITTMAPAALQAENNSKPLKILGIVGFQGEGDAIVEVGREMYSKTLNTFYQWLRSLVQGAGLSYYPDARRIPVVHASLPSNPWELVGTFYGQTLTGDVDGLVNAAIADFAAKDGYAATIDTNASPRLFPDSTQYVQQLIGSDPLHFNGRGEARNGELAADAFIEVANCAIPHTGKAKILEICRMALSHLGEYAAITSIDPPDGTVQAQLCAQFYPSARDSLLEMRSWSFTSRRKQLVEVANTWTEWDYAYALPCDVNNVLAVLPPNSIDDYSTQFAPPNSQYYTAPVVAAGNYNPQPYTIEIDENGYRVLYTDQQDAVLRYNALITDTSQFTPLFTLALSWHLASMLAGPIIKGDVGAAEAKRCAQMMSSFLSRADTQDSSQRNIKPEQITPWMSGR